MELAKLIVDRLTITVEAWEDGYIIHVDGYNAPEIIRNGVTMDEVYDGR